MIEPILNRNFANTFHYHNLPNKIQHIHKNTGRNYQYISFQIPRKSSITYRNEYLHGWTLNKKGVIELIIQHDGKLETCSFRYPLFVKKKAAREQLLHKNHKHGSVPKYFKKNT